MAGSSGLGDGLGTMKNIDPKSVLIGVLATALVIACTDSSQPTSIIPEAKAAAGVGDKWDDKQEWEVGGERGIQGWEPFAVDSGNARRPASVYWRKRVK